MARTTTAILLTLISSSVLSAQSPYASYAHRSAGYAAPYGAGYTNIGGYRDLEIQRAAALRQQVVRPTSYCPTSNRYDDPRAAYRRPEWSATRPPCNVAAGGGGYYASTRTGTAGYGRPPRYAGYPLSNRQVQTRRVLSDRDKYVKDNIYGDETLFDRDQPVRNIFRYIFP